MIVPNSRLKTAGRASNKLVPLHKQIATGLKAKRKPISGK